MVGFWVLMKIFHQLLLRWWNYVDSWNVTHILNGSEMIWMKITHYLICRKCCSKLSTIRVWFSFDIVKDFTIGAIIFSAHNFLDYFLGNFYGECSICIRINSIRAICECFLMFRSAVLNLRFLGIFWNLPNWKKCSFEDVCCSVKHLIFR